MPRSKFITQCTENEEGDLLFEIPDEILDKLGWGEGTELEISSQKGRITIKEIANREGSTPSATLQD